MQTDHKDVRQGETVSTEIRPLYSRRFIAMLTALADLIFPSRVASDGSTVGGSDARPEFYVLCRAAWQPHWGLDLLWALVALDDFAMRRFSKRFDRLSKDEGTTLIQEMTADTPPAGWPAGAPEPKRGWAHLLHAVQEGVLAEPGYGGNWKSIGWKYAGF